MVLIVRMQSGVKSGDLQILEYFTPTRESQYHCMSFRRDKGKGDSEDRRQPSRRNAMDF